MKEGTDPFGVKIPKVLEIWSFPWWDSGIPRIPLWLRAGMLYIVKIHWSTYCLHIVQERLQG
jgi:hypothetical protein